MYITLTDGQSVTILYGWIVVSLISLCIAASLAEICAVYPTAGGGELLRFVQTSLCVAMVLGGCLVLSLLSVRGKGRQNCD